MSEDLYGLQRFVEAQANGVHLKALEKLRAGGKPSHWMWFVCPQVAGLGSSPMAQHYAIEPLPRGVRRGLQMSIAPGPTSPAA